MIPWDVGAISFFWGYVITPACSASCCKACLPLKNSLTIPCLAIGQPQRRFQFSLTSFLKVIITLFASDSQNDLFRYALAHEPGGAG